MSNTRESKRKPKPIPLADFYEKYYTINGRTPAPLREYERWLFKQFEQGKRVRPC